MDFSAGQRRNNRHNNIVALEKQMDRLTDGGLTDAGKQFVIAAADVFHDRELTVNGVPDYRTHRTITQKIMRTTTFSRPSEISPGSNWNLNIFSTPSNLTAQAWLAANQGDAVVPLTPYDGVLLGDGIGQSGTITMSTSNAANNIIYPPTGTDVRLSGLSPSQYAGRTFTKPADNYTQGQHRCFAAGFEVSMTANSLNDGGNVIVYRQAASAQESMGTVLDPVRAAVGIATVIARGPPHTVDEAMLLPGSRRWPAKLGCYVPLMLAENDLPFRQMRGQFLQVSSDTIPEPSTGTFGVTQRQDWLVWPSPGIAFAGPPGISTNLFHCSGAYFQGINSEATLTVVTCFYMEREPSVTESDLVVLARPSPPADELAWRVYSEMVRTMPAGCPVDDNAFGAWFLALLGGLAADVAPYVLKAGREYMDYKIGSRVVNASNGSPAIVRMQQPHTTTTVITTKPKKSKAKKRAARKKTIYGQNIRTIKVTKR